MPVMKLSSTSAYVRLHAKTAKSLEPKSSFRMTLIRCVRLIACAQPASSPARPKVLKPRLLPAVPSSFLTTMVSSAPRAPLMRLVFHFSALAFAPS